MVRFYKLVSDTGPVGRRQGGGNRQQCHRSGGGSHVVCVRVRSDLAENQHVYSRRTTQLMLYCEIMAIFCKKKNSMCGAVPPLRMFPGSVGQVYLYLYL
jgi:hypothetical protein